MTLCARCGDPCDGKRKIIQTRGAYCDPCFPIAVKERLSERGMRLAERIGFGKETDDA